MNVKKDFKLGGLAGASQLQEQTAGILAESEFNLKFIKPENLIPNKLNTAFSQTDIDELSRSIEDIGLQHNLVVLKQDDGFFRIISGERRYRAIGSLLERNPGHIAFKRGIPCKVISGISEVEEEIRLLRSNTDTRELSPAERRNAVLRLIDLYKARKEGGEIKSIYAELSNDLQMSVRQVKKYAATGNLIPDLEELLSQGIITLTEGERYSVLDEEGQAAIAELYKQQGSVSTEELDELKRLKEEKELIKKELSSKISDLVSERERLLSEIEEQKRNAANASVMMERPDADLEEIVLKKAEAENTARSLMRQKEQLQEKYDKLKEELRRPVEVDKKKLEEVKTAAKVEAALSRMEADFALVKAKHLALASDPELLNRYHILKSRINAFEDASWVNGSVEEEN